MNVLVAGATGYIGSGVLKALLAAGHSVTAVVRSEKGAEAVRRQGAQAVVADMRAGDTVRALASEADGVVTTASPGDATSAHAEADFAEAVLEGLREGGVLVRTGGVWGYGANDAITEDSPLAPPAIVAWRPALDTRFLAAPGIRSVLIDPAIVYGHGKGIGAMVASAEQVGEPGALRLIGPGSQHWPTVHVDDLAELYVAALERGEAGERYLGAGGDNPTVRDLGEAASRRRGLDGRIAPEDAAATIERLGALGEALLLDQQASGNKAREALGWKPSRPSLIEEFTHGGYDQE